MQHVCVTHTLVYTLTPVLLEFVEQLKCFPRPQHPLFLRTPAGWLKNFRARTVAT